MMKSIPFLLKMSDFFIFYSSNFEHILLFQLVIASKDTNFKLCKKEKFMKLLMMSMALLVMAFSPAQLKAEDNNVDANLQAIIFYADWCGSCKVLDPNFEQAQNDESLIQKNVEFIKLDLTNAKTSKLASEKSSSIGMSDYYEQNNGKTGYVLLRNSITGENLGKITKEMNAESIVAILNEKSKSL
jgi:thiol:disulfide interchange protein